MFFFTKKEKKMSLQKTTKIETIKKEDKNSFNHHLVVGYGEIGQAIFITLQKNKKNEVYAIDPSMAALQTAPVSFKVNAIHICIPFEKKNTLSSGIHSFNKEIKEKYIDKYSPDVIIIHSTVPIGTTEKIGSLAVSSPCRGKHPFLAKSIMEFSKFFGGQLSKMAADMFRECGVKCLHTPCSKTTEAMKLWDTTQYGIMIILEKIIHDFCKENKVDFDLIYTLANKTYNEGYNKLDIGEYARPVLEHIPGGIGGHCVMENVDLLEEKMLTRFIKEVNIKAMNCFLK